MFITAFTNAQINPLHARPPNMSQQAAPFQYYPQLRPVHITGTEGNVSGHATKVYGGRGVTAPLNLNLSTLGRRAVSLKPRQLYPVPTDVHSNTRCDGLQ